MLKVQEDRLALTVATVLMVLLEQRVRGDHKVNQDHKGSLV